MEKLYKVFWLLAIFPTVAFSQLPGGVKGFDYWLFATDKDSASFKNSPAFINYHNAKIINGQSSLENLKYQSKSKDLSVFVVMKPSYQQENAQIIDIQTDSRSVSIQSDRIKSKNDLKIQNFNSEKPFILSYIESIDEKNEEDSLVGNASSIKEHADKFEGEIAEMIFYPKFLSKLKRRKIETYLSLKYGISLAIDADYINSKGDTIWKSNENDFFRNRITGIGVDVQGNFNNKQSSNVDDYQLLTIGFGKEITEKNRINNKSLNDLNYLLWADNNKEIDFIEDKNNNLLSILNRIWGAKIIGNSISLENITFSFDSIALDWEEEKTQSDLMDIEHAPELVYWLVAMPGLHEAIEIENLEFIQKVSFPDQNEKFTFSNISLSDFKETFMFSIARAPEMFPIITQEIANCNANLNLRVIGGKAPYQVELFSELDEKFLPVKNSEDKFTFNDIPPGEYRYKITDSLNHLFQQNISVKANNLEPLLIDDLFLKKGEAHLLDLSVIQNEDLSEIIWFQDGKQIGDGLKSYIKESGKYEVLYLNRNGCQQSSEFNVFKMPEANWSGIYPNPVKANEDFFIKLNEISNSDGKITITDELGRILKTKVLKKGSSIYADRFFQKGVYLVLIETQNEKNQYSIIIQ